MVSLNTRLMFVRIISIFKLNELTEANEAIFMTSILLLKFFLKP